LSETRWEGAEPLRQHLVPIDSLVPDPKNGRFDLSTPQGRGAQTKHLKRLQESLLRWGQVRAVLVDPDGMLVELGWTHIAAISNEFASDDDRHDFSIADNHLAAQGWAGRANQLALGESVTELTGTGFDADQLESLRLIGGQTTQQVPIDELTPHPANYREHEDAQLEHLTASLKEHGIYRNIVVANDGTILAGHGLVEAARKIGAKVLPVTRLACGPDDPQALKVIAGDNEIAKLGKVDDRTLSDMLKAAVTENGPEALLGTGFDPQTLASLVMTTRGEAEIEHFDAATEWIGMPQYEVPDNRIKLVISFTSLEDREEMVRALGLEDGGTYARRWTLTAWWPPRGERQDLKSLLFVDGREVEINIPGNGQMDVDDCIAEVVATLPFPDLPPDHPANVDAIGGR